MNIPTRDTRQDVLGIHNATAVDYAYRDLMLAEAETNRLAAVYNASNKCPLAHAEWLAAINHEDKLFVAYETAVADRKAAQLAKRLAK